MIPIDQLTLNMGCGIIDMTIPHNIIADCLKDRAPFMHQESPHRKSPVIKSTHSLTDCDLIELIGC